MKIKIFISGKITGEPILKCIDKFLGAKHELGRQYRFCDVEILIPLFLRGIHFGIDHEEAMKICLDELKTCTHIYMLSDWKESKGAQIENQFALENNIKIIYQ